MGYYVLFCEVKRSNFDYRCLEFTMICSGNNVLLEFWLLYGWCEWMNVCASWSVLCSRVAFAWWPCSTIQSILGCLWEHAREVRNLEKVIHSFFVRVKDHGSNIGAWSLQGVLLATPFRILACFTWVVWMHGLHVLYGVYLNVAFAWFVKNISVCQKPELDDLSVFWLL